MTTHSRNWTRGLFRLWVVLTVVWITVCATIIRPDQHWAQYTESRARVSELAENGFSVEDLTKEQSVAFVSGLKRAAEKEFQQAWSAATFFLIIGPGGAAILFVVGASLLWAFRGFRG